MSRFDSESFVDTAVKCSKLLGVDFSTFGIGDLQEEDLKMILNLIHIFNGNDYAKIEKIKEVIS